VTQVPSAKVLLADDQLDVTAALRLLLKSDGVETRSVSSPGAVLDSVRQDNFDLLLMDLNYTRDTTSGREGLELLAQLRALDSPPGIIVMTAWGSVELAVRAMQAGARDFILKPWENERLLATVRKHLAAPSVPPGALPERDLSIARRVQTKLLPQEFPALRTLEYSAHCAQAGAVGGDYYDFIRTGDERILLVLADVSGKGIPAALLMANLQATLRSHCQRRVDNLSVLAQAVNRFFYDSTEPEHFATMFLGEYDDRTRRLQYVNCGHNPPLAVRGSGQRDLLQPTGTVIGAFTPYRAAMAETKIDSGDTLVICSDGVLEARNGEGEQFGDLRLGEVLQQHLGAPVGSLPREVAGAVAKHSAYGQEDDLTVIVARGT